MSNRFEIPLLHRKVEEGAGGSSPKVILQKVGTIPFSNRFATLGWQRLKTIG